MFDQDHKKKIFNDYLEKQEVDELENQNDSSKAAPSSRGAQLP
eukprot:CAMPEP_0170499606 /NCGR_PEP_ID=MMETSP0208-20121228/31947_1 /TAXON_ID=197538 /ORGANISM="Strombidium inclinatum, Strain S3" /LENGTH=42 /DNA_ID= /DNA_START= /DNA_END= /DNA_ORIENTATION=